MTRAPLSLIWDRPLLFAGVGAELIYAWGDGTDRLIAFDSDWGLSELPDLHIERALIPWSSGATNQSLILVGEHRDGPCFLARHTGSRTLYVPGTEPDAEIALFSPLSEGGSWAGVDAAGLYRIADGSRLGAAPEESLGWHTLPGALVSTSRNGPIRLLPFHGGKPREAMVAGALEARAYHPVVAGGDSLFVATGEGVVELSATTLEERACGSFEGDVLAMYPIDDALFVLTDETLFVVERLGELPRAVAKDLRPHRVVTGGNRWLTLNEYAAKDALAYVGEGARVGRLLRFESWLGQAHACHGGVLFVEKGVWTFVPWDLLSTASEVTLPTARLTLRSSSVVLAEVKMAGATLLKVDVIGDSPSAGSSSLLPSRGNPLGLQRGDIVRAEGLELGSTFHAHHVRLKDDMARREDELAYEATLTIAVEEVTRAPRWIATLVKRGFIDRKGDVAKHLWHLNPIDALQRMFGPREAIARRFLHYGRRVWNYTDDPAADLCAMVGLPKLGISAKPRPSDAEIIEIRESALDGSSKLTKIDVDDGLEPIVRIVNNRLMETDCPLRIYVCLTDSDGYAFVACTAKEAAELGKVGFDSLILNT